MARTNLSKLYPQTEELLKDHQLYHSEFQMDYLITIRAGGTVYGMYKQALRELYKRQRGLKQLNIQRDLMNVEIEEMKSKGKSMLDRYSRRRLDIALVKTHLDMEDLERNIKETEREFDRFYKQCSILKSRVGGLTPKGRDKLDREMWEHKLKCTAAVDIITTGRLSNNTVEMLQSFPTDMRKRVIEILKEENHSKLTDWFLGFEESMKLLDAPETQAEIAAP